LDLPAATNGKGGGVWDDPETWDGGEAPEAEARVIVEVGDTLVVAGQARCAGMLIKEGARLTFDPSGASLTSRGDVNVSGAVEMGPQSALWIDCPSAAKYGISIKRDMGTFHARGSHAFDRNCRLGALTVDGRHNTYIYASNPKGLSLRACDISGLGGRMPKDRGGQECGIYFIYGQPVTIEDCRFHHCHSPLFCNAGRLTLRNNEFVNNTGRAACVRCTRESVVEGNYFEQNGEALSVRGKRWHANTRVTHNLFVGNRTGLHVDGPLGRSTFAFNTYLRNDVGILIWSDSATIAGETLAGNRYGVSVTARQAQARVTECVFGTFQKEALPNTDADVRVLAPGPANLTLEKCEFPATPRIVFDADASEKPQPRWVKSRGGNQKPGRWDAPAKEQQGER